jgi:hypothetical protein
VAHQGQVAAPPLVLTRRRRPGCFTTRFSTGSSPTASGRRGGLVFTNLIQRQMAVRASNGKAAQLNSGDDVRGLR